MWSDAKTFAKQTFSHADLHNFPSTFLRNKQHDEADMWPQTFDLGLKCMNIRWDFKLTGLCLIDSIPCMPANHHCQLSFIRLSGVWMCICLFDHVFLLFMSAQQHTTHYEAYQSLEIRWAHAVEILNRKTFINFSVVLPRPNRMMAVTFEAAQPEPVTSTNNNVKKSWWKSLGHVRKHIFSLFLCCYFPVLKM